MLDAGDLATMERRVSTSRQDEQMVFIWETWTEGEPSARALVDAANAGVDVGPFRVALRHVLARLMAGREIGAVPPDIEAASMAAVALFTGGLTPEEGTLEMIACARARHIEAEILRAQERRAPRG